MNPLRRAFLVFGLLAACVCTPVMAIGFPPLGIPIIILYTAYRHLFRKHGMDQLTGQCPYCSGAVKFYGTLVSYKCRHCREKLIVNHTDHQFVGAR